jgi:hypothetical protein
MNMVLILCLISKLLRNLALIDIRDPKLCLFLGDFGGLLDIFVRMWSFYGGIGILGFGTLCGLLYNFLLDIHHLLVRFLIYLQLKKHYLPNKIAD